MDNPSARVFLRRLFESAVASANPAEVLARYLPDKPKGRCVVVGAGKASAAMAAALERAWPDVELTGVVVTRYGHAVPTTRIRIVEASHPVPDNNSVLAAREILAAVTGLCADDLVIALISGGGSALLVAPAAGLALADKQDLNRALLRSGASIGEMNIVRKHLSAIKGGKLAIAAAPARVVTLVISDVPGDDPAIIASGPTVADHSTPAQALEILHRYDVVVPEAVIAHLQRPFAPEAQGPIDVRMIATPLMALQAAARCCADTGVVPLILGDALEGEARDVAKVMAGMAMCCQDHGLPAAAPCVLLSGGEATVTIRGDTAGRGGRNTEFLLALATALSGRAGIWAIAGDTDGVDGTEDAAGALVLPDTLARARAAGMNPADFMAGHDSYSLFKALDDLVMTGPTLTNVNDFRAILVLPA